MRNLLLNQSEIGEAQAKFFQEDIRVHTVRFGDGGTTINISLRNVAGRMRTQFEEQTLPPPGVDVISVVDMSGSMCSCVDFRCLNDQQRCENVCRSTCVGGVYETKNANHILINTILENNLSRVGLVGYNTIVYAPFSNDLTNDSLTLNF